MRVQLLAGGVVGVAVLGLATCASFGQQRLSDRLSEGVQDVGRTVKRGVQGVGDGVRRQFDVVRADVHRMETHSRVYSRLHWEQSLHGSKIEVYMLRDGTALLVGNVPDEAAKERAVEIVKSTVGINSVIDELHPMVASKPVQSSTRSTK